MTPDGTPVFDRVVADAGEVLAAALDRSLTGTAVLEPGDAVLLDGEGRGVLGIRDGVPVAARHAGTGRTGADAVADLADAGPYRVTLYANPDGPADAGGAVDPAVPADLLASDVDLAARLREAAPADAGGPADSADAVEAFLADEETIAGIRERAREEAARRAEEWGFADATE